MYLTGWRENIFSLFKKSNCKIVRNDFNGTSVMQTYLTMIQFESAHIYLQWGVGTSLKCDWQAAETVETDAVKPCLPGWPLKWSGPLYTFQSHETFIVCPTWVHLPCSLAGGELFKNLQLMTSLLPKILFFLSKAITNPWSVAALPLTQP